LGITIIGIVKEEEPFKKLVHQGVITYNGEKMSKTKGNVVSPDNYDSDELRMYPMFIGPYSQGGDWNDSQIKGVRRFIGKMKRWLSSAKEGGEDLDLIDFSNKIDKYVESFKFNKVVSSFMEFYNQHKKVEISKKTALEINAIINCFIPGFTWS